MTSQQFCLDYSGEDPSYLVDGTFLTRLTADVVECHTIANLEDFQIVFQKGTVIHINVVSVRIKNAGWDSGAVDVSPTRVHPGRDATVIVFFCANWVLETADITAVRLIRKFPVCNVKDFFKFFFVPDGSQRATIGSRLNRLTVKFKRTGIILVVGLLLGTTKFSLKRKERSMRQISYI